MKKIKGDLIKLALEGQFDVIIHGCNCFCTMGAGIAKGIKLQFPEAFKADKETSKGDKNKLGNITMAKIQRLGSTFFVVNAYTQYNYRGSGRKADYDAIRNCFKEIKNQFSGNRIGYPAIGAGLAGGDWGLISSIIEEELSGEDHCFIEFQP